MIDTIRADFYRLFRSKGFWITEFFFLSNILTGAIYGSVGTFGVSVSQSGNSNQAAQQVQHGWTAFEALVNISNTLTTTVFFTLVIVTLSLGIDLTQKLYKNVLTSGISRTEFYLSKTVVVSCLTVLQLLATYGIAFVTGLIANGLGTAPANWLPHLLLTVGIQTLCTLAWVSIISLVLYISFSIPAVFIAYLIATLFLSLPAIFFPKTEWLSSLALSFNFEMASQANVSLRSAIIALILALLFMTAGLLAFQKKDL